MTQTATSNCELVTQERESRAALQLHDFSHVESQVCVICESGQNAPFHSPIWPLV